MNARIFSGDCRTILEFFIEDNSVDAVVTDPPYGLTSARPGGRSAATRGAVMGGFMGLTWDSGVPGVEVWREVLRVLKPGGHLLAFGGSRTYHRLACAIEDAGFEIRDQIMWLYGSGFPKSLDVSRAIDEAAGASVEFVPMGNPVKRMIPGADQNSTGSWIKDNGRTYQPGVRLPATPESAAWQGWGTALKPAHEPIVLARKPLAGTVASNVLEHSTGALNIDESRVETTDGLNGGAYAKQGGRWPANVLHDGSEEVLSAFPQAPGQQGKTGKRTQGTVTEGEVNVTPRGDVGSAARFFYCAKASRTDRGEGNTHPTVKPTDLMRYLVRLVTPPGGVVLDPYCGSGSTGKAAVSAGFKFIGIELDESYVKLAMRRISQAS